VFLAGINRKAKNTTISGSVARTAILAPSKRIDTPRWSEPSISAYVIVHRIGRRDINDEREHTLTKTALGRYFERFIL
jgi:hypothetical protein